MRPLDAAKFETPIGQDEKVQALVEQGAALGWPPDKQYGLCFVAANWEREQIAAALGIPENRVDLWMRDPAFQRAVGELRGQHAQYLMRGLEAAASQVLLNIMELLQQSTDLKVKADMTKWAAGALGVTKAMETAAVQVNVFEGAVDQRTLIQYIVPALKEAANGQINSGTTDVVEGIYDEVLSGAGLGEDGAEID